MKLALGIALGVAVIGNMKTKLFMISLGYLVNFQTQLNGDSTSMETS